MNRPAATFAVIQGTLVVGFTLGMARGWFPLGVPGEWEWLRLPTSTTFSLLNLALGGVGVLAYALFAALGVRSLLRSVSRLREATWVAALAGVAVVAQVVVQEGAPDGYGLSKWIMALRDRGSSGYHTIALKEMPDGLRPFLRTYSTWIAGQDSLHIGTHPPGLFVVARSMLDLTRANPGLARQVIHLAPESVTEMIQTSRSIKPITREDAAALVLTGALTLICSALTVVPLYLLIRASQPASIAWTAATLWPLMPAAILFQPTADTAFPLLASGALATAMWASRTNRGRSGSALAVGSGISLAVGMEFTLAYLGSGLVVAFVLLGCPGPHGWRSRLLLVGWTGLGFAAASAIWWGLTSSNPLAVWWINQRHHGEFYSAYPRTFWLWSGVNVIETVVAIGLASTVLAGWGALRPKFTSISCWATLAVMVLLTISGRSLSEVARIWLPLFPPLLEFTAVGWNRLGGHPSSLAWTVVWVGTQTLALESMIQVVYPI